MPFKSTEQPCARRVECDIHEPKPRPAHGGPKRACESLNARPLHVRQQTPDQLRSELARILLDGLR